MRTQWNDDEDRALDYLPYVDQVIYLRGIRRRMDFDTGYAGMNPEYPISYLWLSQMTEVHPRPCSKMKPPPRLDKNGLRAVFDRLEAAGLVQRVRDHGLKSLVFFCVLADRGQSAQKMNNPSTTHEQPTLSNPPKPSNGASCDGMNNPSTTHPYEAMSNPIQGSGDPEDRASTSERERHTSNSRGTRLSLTACPAEWLDWARTERPDLDITRTWAMFSDHWAAQPGAKGCKTNWQSTWRNWVRREDRHNGSRYEPHEKPHHRIQREQFERVAAHDWSDGPPFNDGPPCEVG